MRRRRGCRRPLDRATTSESRAAIDDVPSPLIDSLRWRSMVFHVGQYCGTWRGSTAGHQQASFHFVLQGEAWLLRQTTPRAATRR